MLLKKNDKILFIGDSITDAGVTNTEVDSEGLGFGYVRFIKDYLYTKYPEAGFEIVNKGVSGERSVDLLTRWQRDVIDQKPDFLSICIGTNDIWRQYDSELQAITPDIYEENLRRMLKWTKDELNIPVILIEVQPIEKVCLNMDWDFRFRLYNEGGVQVKDYNERVHKVAAEFDAYYCPVNKLMAHNTKKNPLVSYTNDGVHPNSTGIVAIGISFINSLGL